MGYFKNQEVELQEMHDDHLRSVVAWDRAHRSVLSADARWLIMTNEAMMDRALALWQEEPVPPPKPASSHVALQEPAVKRKDMREASRSGMSVAGWSMIATAVVIAAAILAVML